MTAKTAKPAAVTSVAGFFSNGFDQQHLPDAEYIAGAVTRQILSSRTPADTTIMEKTRGLNRPVVYRQSGGK